MHHGGVSNNRLTKRRITISDRLQASSATCRGARTTHILSIGIASRPPHRPETRAKDGWKTQYQQIKSYHHSGTHASSSANAQTTTTDWTELPKHKQPLKVTAPTTKKIGAPGARIPFICVQCRLFPRC